MVNNFELRGVAENPFHFSVGLVIVHDNKIVVIRNEDNEITLPRETIWLNESLEDCAKRGAKEELNFRIQPTRYLGTITTVIQKKNNLLVDKTTAYFVCDFVEHSSGTEFPDGEVKEIMWLTPEETIKLLKEHKNEEYKIVERLIKMVKYGNEKPKQ